MPNRFFNNIIDLVNNTRARASDVESNFSAVEAGFDAAQADIDAKAGLSSPAFTGTPTAPTAVPGANTTQIATAAFVQTAIASAAGVNLPVQTGQSGKFLTTNGTLPSWETVPPPTPFANNEALAQVQAIALCF